MARHSIELTEQEQELRKQILLEVHVLLDHEAAAANGRLVRELMKSLLGRKAIPEHRLRYWADPAFFHGPQKTSRRGLFERNGSVGDAIYENTGFLRHFRYLLDGADLPSRLIDDFCARVDDCGHVGPSDALELAQHYRKALRAMGLKPNAVCDEFYKLALDCGVYEGHAKTIRDVLHRAR